MTKTLTETAPAKILIQIREGVPNLIHEFQLALYDSRPAAPGRNPKAKYDHDILNVDVIKALRDAADEWERKTDRGQLPD